MSQDSKLDGLIYKLTSCSNCYIARKWDRENCEISWLTSSSWVSSDLFLLGLQIQLDSLPNVLERCLSEPGISCQSLPGCKWSISREGFCHSNTEGICFLFTKTIWDLKNLIFSHLPQPTVAIYRPCRRKCFSNVRLKLFWFAHKQAAPTILLWTSSY